MDNDLKDIHTELGKINLNLAVYNEQLKEHMRRTDILEKKLQPVETHVQRVNGIIAFILFISGLTYLIKFLQGK
jgi:hypothetical protein